MSKPNFRSNQKINYIPSKYSFKNIIDKNYKYNVRKSLSRGYETLNCESEDDNKTSNKDETTVLLERQYKSSQSSLLQKQYVYDDFSCVKSDFKNVSLPSQVNVSKVTPQNEKSSYGNFIQYSKDSILRLFYREKDSKHNHIEDIRQEVNIIDHLLPLDQLYSLLETNPSTGLSEIEALRRLSRDGYNSLPVKQSIHSCYILLRYIFQGFSTLLWLGSLLSFFAYFLELKSKEVISKDNLWLGIALASTCIVTGVFSFFYERKTSHITESFNKMIPNKATVLRGSVVKRIDASELVRGDVVLLKMGDKIPADIRLVETKDMKVEKSSLTGEVEPVSSTLEATHSSAIETKNLLFFSTNIVSGYGKGVVILTGPRTIMGKIAGLTDSLQKKKTPIEQEIHHFMTVVSIWALLLGSICFMLARFVGYTLLNACVYVIGIIVANVPEGLLGTLTVSLTLTASRLSNNNCVVKRLQTVETLGSIQTICSDKTGTLTQNKMKVVHLYFNGEIYSVTNGTELKTMSSENNTTYKTLVRAACLCSQADYVPNQENLPVNERKIAGDATEEGILYFIQPRIKSLREVRNTFPKVAEIPFNSTNKFHLTIHFSPLNEFFILIKGAPEVILEKCITAMTSFEKELYLTGESRYDLDFRVKYFASQGERVLAFADLHLSHYEYPESYKFSTNPVNFPTQGFRFIGLVTLYDPPKPEVSSAIDACHRAGIRVIMVTGDHPFTAKAIAETVHILSEDSDDACVIAGTELGNLTDEGLSEILITRKQLVFARTSPLQKLRIVQICQSNGEIVAVTGDGVNDAPALKKADIGIAMGITGSEVSKQTADMVLMDDNFSTIIMGIEEGRLIFENLKKSIAYILASNIPEILPFLFYIFIGIPLPVSTFTILCIDLGTDMWPAVALAYERPESNVMTKEPRNIKSDHLVDMKLLNYAYFHIGLLETLSGFLCYFHVMYDAGWFPMDLLNIRNDWESNKTLLNSLGQQSTLEERLNTQSVCQTAYFIAIVIAQCSALTVFKTRYNSFFQKKMNNWALNFGLAFEIIIAIMVSYNPSVNKALNTKPVNLKYWTTALPVAFVIMMYGEIGKLCNNYYPESYLARLTSW